MLITVLYSLTAAGVGAMGFLVIGTVTLYFIWKFWQRRKLISSVRMRTDTEVL